MTADSGWVSTGPDWRKNRESGWHRDIGYQLQEVLGAHRYEVMITGSDIGRHACSCGTWAGYWTDFFPHLADALRAVTLPHIAECVRAALVMPSFPIMAVCARCGDKRCPGALSLPCTTQC